MTIKPVIPNGFASQLFPTLVTAFAPSDHRPLRVLDLGPASAATVAFFSQYRCTLRFADLNPGELMPPPGDDGEVPDRDAHLRRLLELPLGSKFDICLFWDYLNHLDDEAVRALARVLRPHLHSASRGHGFAVLNRGNALHHQNYGVMAADLLMVTGESRRQPLAHPHSQAGLNGLLGGFEVTRGVLRADGRLEILLRTL
ncbi:MAG: hypothetical protein WDA10_10480 [Porticoccaceae bacterium]|jgi:SAM-dependent methyltransferase|nr:hypothetical protein [Porticoccaceae bacterium]MEA3299252.1 hypothetical protein [Pseudomonadota bacterium]HLS97605.1 hypothetical protein [Porticoccaceae bacterium]